VTFAAVEEGGTVPAPQVYDLELQGVSRTPNGKIMAAEKAGVAVTDRVLINFDIQMRTNVPHIFAIGDIVGQPMLAHKAVHEAHVAVESGRTCHHEAATAKNVVFKAVGLLQRRAILGLLRLNFLSGS
jgi:pyruvate/2-oxoglutarate dehydrogenase complex dihydrolipoamide dehydrogenase (E3) component